MDNLKTATNKLYTQHNNKIGYVATVVPPPAANLKQKVLDRFILCVLISL